MGRWPLEKNLLGWGGTIAWEATWNYCPPMACSQGLRNVEGNLSSYWTSDGYVNGPFTKIGSLWKEVQAMLGLHVLSKKVF